MLICNIKLNKNNIFKIIIGIMIIIVIVIGIMSICNFSHSINNYSNKIDDELPQNKISQITAENYTNILREVHNNIDTYVGQEISFTGYVYRVSNFKDDQFVLARDMDIGNNQSLVVGFLCSCEKIKDYDNYTWVNVTGTIEKGKYNNTDIPILKISDITITSKPENPTVPIPSDEYVPTAVIY